MARRKRSSFRLFSIGNCEVEVEGSGFACDSTTNAGSLLISFSDTANIRISANDSRKYMTTRARSRRSSDRKPQDNGEEIPIIEANSFLLVNPKDIDSRNKSLLQEILKIYVNALPSMTFSANTRKKSLFLEKCVSNGKYRTLVLRTNSVERSRQIIAAISYQIIPADTQFAEIPLAVVCSNYQKKGIGFRLYEELKRRLQGVGVMTIFCWADKKSEGFWTKQGFVSIGDVDNMGRAHRLPIKAEIRRALCFLGGSTLMVAHLGKQSIPVKSPDLNLCIYSKSHAKLPIPAGTTKSNFVDKTVNVFNAVPQQTEKNTPRLSERVRCSTDDGNLDGFPSDALTMQISSNLAPSNSLGPDKVSVDIWEVEKSNEAGSLDCSFSGLNAKRRVWEASLSSLKSKRIKASHHVGCGLDSELDVYCGHAANEVAFKSNIGKALLKLPLKVSQFCSSTFQGEGIKADHDTDEPQSINKLVLERDHPKVMFMNIADSAKKACLTKIVEELGGTVTSSGGISTHVITGKARRTLNFCIGLCSGAWILSSSWLKESLRAGKLLDESKFLLEDSDYASKYKSELKEAVVKAKANPCALLKGYQICMAKHVQPSVKVLSAIVETAGGKVIRRLCTMHQRSKTIFLACEEDMEDALTAAKKGVWTYSSEWFMSCVMKQELDFEAPQFTESL